MKTYVRKAAAESGRTRAAFRGAGLALCCVMCGLGLTAWAQYAIDWSTVDGGGGTSSGSQYVVTGTAGQPDAGGPMTGGSYSITGGFWSYQAIQTPGAPILTIITAGTNQVTISWEPDTPGWVLQETQDLASDTWSDSPSGATNPITVSVDVTIKFYRLTKS